MNRRNRKTNRKNRNRNNRHRRGSRKNRCMWGGDPASVNDTSMALSHADSLAQGQQFAGLHNGQHGGAGIQLVGGGGGGGGGAYPASVVSSTLPNDMVAAARTGPINAAIAAIQGMKDQAGGRRNRKSTRKNRSNWNRSNRNRSNRNRKNRNRRQMGGGELFMGSPVSSNSMLLPSGMEKQAALNYEWSLASDPSAFAPKQT